MRRVVVGLPRASRVAAAVALIEAEAQCSVLGVVLRVLGQQRGRSSNRRRASPIDQCLRSSARECGTLPLAFVLFSFFFTLLSLADELLSAAARPVSRICIGGENSLSASARKTLEASKKKKSRVCQSSPVALPLPFRLRSSRN